DRTDLPMGWVLPHWDDEHRQLAENLAPDYLFVNHKRLPPQPFALWDGPWQWVVYTVNRAEEIPLYLERGFAMIETNEIRSLLGGQPGHE
ncbi:MAG: hypothetical protein KJO66_08995, partial [Gammaproteobacteria bacterium]|nr:hypothetical protein [Gammaproteobacteria bacterium]